MFGLRTTELRENTLSNFKVIDRKHKVHYLYNHFHQAIKSMKDQYQASWDNLLIANYCWCLLRDCSGKHQRKSYKKNGVITDEYIFHFAK